MRIALGTLALLALAACSTPSPTPYAGPFERVAQQAGRPPHSLIGDGHRVNGDHLERAIPEDPNARGSEAYRYLAKGDRDREAALNKDKNTDDGKRSGPGDVFERGPGTESKD